jgi:tetratricopeptide (TPR) repeat protein
MNRKIVYLIAFLLFIFSGIRLIFLGYVLTGMLLIVGLFTLSYKYIRNGLVGLALLRISANDFLKAKKLLEATLNPEWLCKAQQGYYYWAIGLVNLEEGKLEQAERQLIRAHNLGVKTQEDRILIYLSLAQTYLKKGNLEKAQSFITKAENTPHKEVLVAVIQALKNEIFDSNINCTNSTISNDDLYNKANGDGCALGKDLVKEEIK